MRNDVQQLYTIAEAATQLRLGRRAVYELMSAGELPYVQLTSRRRVIPHDAIAEFLASREVRHS